MEFLVIVQTTEHLKGEWTTAEQVCDQPSLTVRFSSRRLERWLSCSVLRLLFQGSLASGL